MKEEERSGGKVFKEGREEPREVRERDEGRKGEKRMTRSEGK